MQDLLAFAVGKIDFNKSKKMCDFGLGEKNPKNHNANQWHEQGKPPAFTDVDKKALWRPRCVRSHLCRRQEGGREVVERPCV